MVEERSVPDIIDDFLAEGPYAVVGASTDRDKYGNKVFRAYLQSKRKAYPVNPKADEVEGHPAYADLASLPERPRGVSIITPPKVTEKVVEDAAAVGAKFVWMQPGAESPEAIRKARELGLEVVADGSCVLVVTGFREE
jgi:predicted CoA-binding protein